MVKYVNQATTEELPKQNRAECFLHLVAIEAKADLFFDM